MTSDEGIAIKRALDASGVKAVVSHQHRYGDHYKKVKSIIASGAIGKVYAVYGTATGWAAHMLSHLVDYTSWFNEYEPAEWVMGQAAGRGKLDDIHASPDYLAGVAHFRNGVRGVYDCGAGAPDVPEVPYWWRKCRIGALGEEGYAEVHTGSGWRAVTKDGVQAGPGGMDYEHDMGPYVQEMADWLDDERKPHPLRFERAYHGLEIVSGLYRSVIDGGQIALPLTSGMDELAGLRGKVPDRKVLMTLAESAKEYRE
jgi:predicted dehydrogenase